MLPLRIDSINPGIEASRQNYDARMAANDQGMRMAGKGFLGSPRQLQFWHYGGQLRVTAAFVAGFACASYLSQSSLYATIEKKASMFLRA